MGVEEEYLLIGRGGSPVAVAAALLDAVEKPGSSASGVTAEAESEADEPSDSPGGELEAELKQQQIETGTHPCADLGDLAEQIREGRRQAEAAANDVGAHIAALGTAPMKVRPVPSRSERYQRIDQQFALTAREQLTCGCHVHVEIADDEEGVAVLDRIGAWLPSLLAISGNSPFWQEQDSGYASFRSQVWNRWPTAGPVAPFGSAAAYHATVESLVNTGAILDTGMVYFDARLSAKYPTLEVRVADVCLDAGDAALVAALVRGLVETAAREAVRGEALPPARVEMLRAGNWRAARSGVSGELVSPVTHRPRPAREVLTELLDHVRVALVDAGDLDMVRELLEQVLTRGNGADAQRRWYAEEGDLGTVVGRAVAATQGGTAS